MMGGGRNRRTADKAGDQGAEGSNCWRKHHPQWQNLVFTQRYKSKNKPFGVCSRGRGDKPLKHLKQPFCCLNNQKKHSEGLHNYFASTSLGENQVVFLFEGQRVHVVEFSWSGS